VSVFGLTCVLITEEQNPLRNRLEAKRTPKQLCEPMLPGSYRSSRANHRCHLGGTSPKRSSYRRRFSARPGWCWAINGHCGNLVSLAEGATNDFLPMMI